jgi:hypothetical protein
MSAIVWLSTLNVMFLIVFIACCVILVRSSGLDSHKQNTWPLYLLPVLAVVFMTQGTPRFASRNEGTLLTSFSAIPIRSLLPLALLLFLLCAIRFAQVEESSNRNRRLTLIGGQILFFVAAAVTLLNNFEFGSPMAVAGIAIWAIANWDSKLSRWWYLLIPATFLACIVVLFSVRSQSTGATYAAHWVEFSLAFGSEGFFGVSMPNLGAHSIVLVWAYISIAAGLARLLTNRGSRSLDEKRSAVTLVYCGCWCVASLMYFSGRSVMSGQLQISLIPLSLLLVVWAAPVTSLRSNAFLEPSETERTSLISLLSIGLLFGSLFNIVDFGDKWSSVNGAQTTQLRSLWGMSSGDIADLIAEENQGDENVGVADKWFVYIAHPNLFSEFSGLATVGALNQPGDVVASESLRDLECTSIKRRIEGVERARIFVFKDSLPISEGRSPSQAFADICPGISFQSRETNTFLIIDM